MNASRVSVTGRVRRVRLPALQAVLMLVAAVPAHVAAQTIFTVDAGHITGTSAIDDEVPDGICNAHCSLRDAVLAANSNAGADIIRFAAAGTIALARIGAESPLTNDLDILDDVTIQGHLDGTRITPADMNFGEERVFDINDAAVVIENLTFFGGEANSRGSAVRASNADLIIRNSAFEDNEATSGGAVAIEGGETTIENSTFAGNIAIYDGGAIHVRDPQVFEMHGTVLTDNSAGQPCCSQEFPQGRGGAVFLDYTFTTSVAAAVINLSTFESNTAEDGGISGGDGGAIYARGAPLNISNSVLDGNGNAFTSFGGAILVTGNDGRLTINKTSIINNQAGIYGGAVLVENGEADFTNVTLSGNEAGEDGGAVYVSSADVRLIHTTIANNMASRGDGVYVRGRFASTSVRMGNNLFFGSCDASEADSGVLVSEGGNVEGAGDTCEFDQASDFVGQSSAQLALQFLADNGGAGPTHQLGPTSVARNAGDPSICAAVLVDQRGALRDSDCDSGSVEADASADLIFSDGFEGSD